MLVFVAVLLHGCAADLSSETGTGTTATTAPPLVPPAATTTAEAPAPAAEEGGTLAQLKAMMPKGEQIVGTPTELYTRIARGALTCWFGASGPLKGKYMYHADAAPPSQGGRSEIKILVKDDTAADPRSVRAYRIVIAPGDVNSILETENSKIPEPLATSMGADVRRWAADDEGCSAAPAAGAWTADQAAPDTKKAAKPKAPAKKTADKKKQ